MHLSEELVDVIIVGPRLDDGTRDELLNELRYRSAESRDLRTPRERGASRV